MSFGEQFATPTDFLQAAWDQVLAGAHLPGNLSERAFAAWAAAHRSGQPREEFRVLFELLAGTGWAWAEYDRWKAEFERGGRLPYMWEQATCDTRPDPHGERPRCAILAHSLTITAYTLNNRSTVDANASRLGGYRLWVIPGCAVEAEIAARYAAQIEAGDLTVVPPFFPGDRTTLKPRKR